MAPQKMIKAADEGANLNADFLSDTTPQAIDSVKSWTQVFEILEHKLINSQQDLFMKVDAIQKYDQEIDLDLKDIYIKERESRSARVKFQKAVLLVPKDDVLDVHQLSLLEQIRGDMALKAWETNLAERRRLAREVNEACIEALK